MSVLKGEFIRLEADAFIPFEWLGVVVHPGEYLLRDFLWEGHAAAQAQVVFAHQALIRF